MIKIIAIRHAESVANSKGIYQGQTYDTPLSILGEKQAEALAQAVCKHDLKRIVSSPLYRTMQTAQYISECVGSDVETDDLLLETDHGDWDGKSAEDIERLYPIEWKLWHTLPTKTQMPCGESGMDVVERARQYVQRMKSFNENACIVTHGNTLAFMICEIDNISFDTAVKVDSASYFVIENTDGKLNITKRNVKDHLDGLESDITKQAW